MPTRSRRNADEKAGGSRAPLNLVRAPKTGEVVADQIRRRIVRGELAEGDFLPSEAELIATLEVSRPTLREALRVLEAEQLISVGRGSRTGPCVHAPRVAGVARYAGFALQAEGTTIADIYQARLSIEPYVAAHLAMAKPNEAAARLGAEIAQLAALVDAGNNQDFVIGVAHFHRVLVELSGNRTLLMITRMLQDIVARYQVRRLFDAAARAGRAASGGGAGPQILLPAAQPDRGRRRGRRVATLVPPSGGQQCRVAERRERSRGDRRVRIEPVGRPLFPGDTGQERAVAGLTAPLGPTTPNQVRGPTEYKAFQFVLLKRPKRRI